MKSSKDPLLSYLKPLLFHKKNLEIIESFRKGINGELNKNNSVLKKVDANLTFSNNDYKLKFNLKKISSAINLVGNSIRKLEFQTPHAPTFIVGSLFPTNTNFDGECEGLIDELYTKGFTENQLHYHRLIIPLDKELNFLFTLEDCKFSSDLGYYSRQATKVVINEDTVYAHVIHSGKPKKFYLSIESKQKQSFNAFCEKAFALQQGIGYLCGYLVGGQGYFFAYSNSKMEIPKFYGYRAMRRPIKSVFVPIYTNPYGFLKEDKKQAKKYYDAQILSPLSFTSFSALCQKLHDSLEFSSAILLILESCSSSLLFMPGGFAIALENLSDIIIGDDKNKLAPIKDKRLSKTIRNECSYILQKYSNQISAEDMKILLGRIEQINQTTNKERLKAPFTKLDIILNSEDLKVLESRNDFLHGRVPDFRKKGNNRPLKSINEDLYYASVRFYTLLSLLILKWVGFNNYVLNHPKISEVQCGIKLKEKPYRTLG